MIDTKKAENSATLIKNLKQVLAYLGEARIKNDNTVEYHGVKGKDFSTSLVGTLAAKINGGVVVGVYGLENGNCELLIKTPDGDLGVFAVIQDIDGTTFTVFEPLETESDIDGLNCVISLKTLEGGNLNE